MNTTLPNCSVLSDVHSILESKIQFIEYQAHCNLHECVCDKTDNSNPSLSTSKKLTQNFEWMLQQITLRTSELKLLQIIKCWLCEENLSNVMELLQDNAYRQYSEESLEKMLKKGALELMRLQYN